MGLATSPQRVVVAVEWLCKGFPGFPGKPRHVRVPATEGQRREQAGQDGSDPGRNGFCALRKGLDLDSWDGSDGCLGKGDDRKTFRDILELQVTVGKESPLPGYKWAASYSLEESQHSMDWISSWISFQKFSNLSCKPTHQSVETDSSPVICVLITAFQKREGYPWQCFWWWALVPGWEIFKQPHISVSLQVCSCQWLPTVSVHVANTVGKKYPSVSFTDVVLIQWGAAEYSGKLSPAWVSFFHYHLKKRTKNSTYCLTTI